MTRLYLWCLVRRQFTTYPGCGRRSCLLCNDGIKDRP